jgi:intracellular multiplication protein IcmF
MNTVLLLGQSRSGRQLFLKSLSPEIKATSRGLFTHWKHKNLQWITPADMLNESRIKQLASYQLVMVMLPLPTLLDNTQRLAFIDWLHPQLLQLKQKQCPIIFVISQSDRLLGFSDYFAHYNTDARQSAFGIQHKNEINPFIQTMSQSILAQLHHEPIAEKRARIQAFPAQLNQTFTLCNNLIERCIDNSNLNFNGLFFISTKQKHPVIDALTNQIHSTPPPVTERVFFTCGLLDISQQLTQNYRLQRKQHDKKRWLAMPISVGLILGLLGLWHIMFKHINSTLTKFQYTLHSIQKDANSPHWAQYLRTLQKAQQTLNDPLLASARYLGFSQIHQLKNRINNQYHTLLITRFLPSIQGDLTDAITQNMTRDTTKLYAALRVYLMLTDTQHRHNAIIIDWFSHHWRNNPHLASQLTNLNTLLTLNSQHWPQNKPLIHEARSTLQQLPAANIAFLHLSSHYTDKTQSLATLLPTQSALNLKQIKISTLFSTDNFKDIYNQQIPQVAQHFAQGDWVIGNSDTFKNENTAQLTASLQAIYLSAFSNSWQTILDQLKLNKFNNLNKISTVLTDLTTNDSGLVSSLKFMVGNATLSPDIQPSPTVRYLKKYLSFDTKQDNELRNQLRALNTFIQAVYKSKQPNQASYAVATTILNNQTQANPIALLMHLPIPKHVLLNHWNQNLALQVWQQLLIGSHQYLNLKWQQTVWPIYKSSIKNHYPIDASSQRNTTPENFAAFFGPTGALQTFFNQQLKPFVNTSQHYWVWKKYLGQALPAPQSVLDNFMRGILIQNMFFKNSHMPSFKFSLIPIEKSQTIRSAYIYFDGQAIPFNRNKALQQLITWPGSKNIGASWVIHTNHKKTYQQFYKGPWAALRLIQNGKLSPSNNPQRYTLAFKSGKHHWQYWLIPNRKINPWLPSILQGFYCTAQLNDKL